MNSESLAAALEREHHEIDAGIDGYAGGRGPELLRRSVDALRRHIYLEEEFLFPALYDAGFAGPVLVMLREHAQMWTTLDALERELEVPADGAVALCHQLSVQLQHHNMKEERILYPEVDDLLPGPGAARLREFLDRGTLPEGWTCVHARR
ncbi:MAG TPA: hemerythrin domain-containing protein [Jatrophihabitans sp.]|nr:hemerythrin domain-containing protein [Jatrophihabitans sp.]